MSDLNPFLLLLAFATSLAAVNLIKTSFHQQLIDIPNERSSHSQPIPRGGGLGFILAFAGALLFNQSAPTESVAGIIPTNLWLSLLPLVAIGLLDDRISLPAQVRYGIQLLVSAAVVFQCGAFPQPWLESYGSWGMGIAILASVIGMTALINFYNFMDGLDGLVAGVTAVQFGFLAVWFNEPLLWYMVAALLGFLYWNWSPAKIFMGDVGSTTLGGLIALVLLFNRSDTVNSWTALAITLPLISDAIYTLICRLRRSENIFQAHCSHIYQRLHQAGYSHAQVAGFYIGLTLAIAILLICFHAAAWFSLLTMPPLIGVAERQIQHRNRLNAPVTPQ